LHITKLAASRTRTSGEIAGIYNVKVQVVYDLMKDAKKKKAYFVKKKEVELRREKQHAAVVKSVSTLLSNNQSIWTLK